MIGINFTSAFKASSRRRDAKRTGEIPFSVSSGETSRMEGLEWLGWWNFSVSLTKPNKLLSGCVKVLLLSFYFLRNVERYPFRAKFGTKLSRNVRHNNFVLFSFSWCFAFPSTPAPSNCRLSGRRGSVVFCCSVGMLMPRGMSNFTSHLSRHQAPNFSVTQIEQLKLICLVDIELGPRRQCLMGAFTFLSCLMTRHMVFRWFDYSFVEGCSMDGNVRISLCLSRSPFFFPPSLKLLMNLLGLRKIVSANINIWL